MKSFYSSLVIIVCLISVQAIRAQDVITTGVLLREMIDLERLTKSEVFPYRAIQYSSYDQRSKTPDEPDWFANVDAFDVGPVPGFQEVLKLPGQDGIGEYLICDVKGPGAVVRLWSAIIFGTIRMYLDGKLVYNGAADKFFWNFPAEFDERIDTKGTLRQYDATYFPIPFARSCRIEWAGKVRPYQYYHVGMKLYDGKVKVKTFQPSDIATYRADIDKVIRVMKDPDREIVSSGDVRSTGLHIPKGETKELFRIEGGQAIDLLKMKINTTMPNIVWRQAILRIYFDEASVPQIETPAGDFFGVAPGVNPYVSLPLSVALDGTMTSRFVMPFKKKAVIQIENRSDQNIDLSASVSVKPYRWDDARSMYMRAHWRIDRNLISTLTDIPFVLAMGEGRLVGVACYMLNPSNHALGCWWGEGDEKIYLDNSSFPTFFGTGSEDYFNYSWCSDDVFYYPYCGQPRNDGPSNRGFVSTYRWHIADDIPFRQQLAFYMELYHTVAGFVHARMVYMYGKKGLIDDHGPVSIEDVRPVVLPELTPLSVKPFGFVEAENAVKDAANTAFAYDPLWAGGKILMWTPKVAGEKLHFDLKSYGGGIKDFRVFFGHMENGGKVKMYVNGQLVKLRNNDILDLSEQGRTLNRSYRIEKIDFKEGSNEVILENCSEGEVKIGIDMFAVSG